jgi:RNA recognition motif-containing protein
MRSILEVKLYVGNMSYDMTEDQLRTLFAEAGVVSAVELIKDRNTGRSKGFAFITMGSQAEAENAIKLINGREVEGRPLLVNTAKPREERSFGGGGGGGGYGRSSYGSNRGGGSGGGTRGGYGSNRGGSGDRRR